MSGGGRRTTSNVGPDRRPEWGRPTFDRPHARPAAAAVSLPSVMQYAPRSAAYSDADDRDRPIRLAQRSIHPATAEAPAEERVDHRRRPRQPAPAVLRQARVVEQHRAAGLDEAVPVLPVGAHALLAVVAVDEDEVDGALPALGDGAAVVDVPGHARAGVAARGAGHDAAARALGRPPARRQRPAVVAEGVDEVQLGARRRGPRTARRPTSPRRRRARPRAGGRSPSRAGRPRRRRSASCAAGSARRRRRPSAAARRRAGGRAPGGGWPWAAPSARRLDPPADLAEGERVAAAAAQDDLVAVLQEAARRPVGELDRLRPVPRQLEQRSRAARAPAPRWCPRRRGRRRSATRR